MSNRYVWNRYNIVLRRGSTIQGPTRILTQIGRNSTATIYYSNSIFPATNGTITMQSPATVQLAADGSNQNIEAGDYFYVTIDSERAPIEGVYYAETSIALRHPSGTDHVDILSGTVEIQLRYNKGSVIDTVSNASSSTYPLNNDQWQITSIYSIPIVLVRRCANV